MKVTFDQFKGVMRLREPAALPAMYGQQADNVWLEHGDLRAAETPRFVLNLTKLTVGSIYRFGQATASETTFWFHWANQVSVAKAQVAADTAERTIFTGDGVPKFATAALSTAGGNLPSADRPLALPPPAVAPVLTAVTGTGTTGVVRRDYAYTFFNEFGDESAPSPVGTITCATNQHVALASVGTVPANGAPISGRYVYRSEAGVYLYVGAMGAVGSEFTDTVATDDLGAEIESTDWDPPPDNLQGLVNLPNGLMAAFSGRDLYFTDPYRPYAWPEKYRLAMPFPIVALGVVDQSIVVVTTGTSYVVTGIDPGGMDQRPSALRQPGASRMSTVSTGTDVIYASESGLCLVGVGRGEVITSGLFTPAQWAAKYNPATIVAVWHEGVYLATYLDGATRRGFAYWPATQAFVDLPDFAATAFYRDTVTRKLFCAVGPQIWVFRDGSSVYNMRWTSPRVLTALTEFTWISVYSTKYPVTVDVVCSGVVRDTVTVTSVEPQRIGDVTDQGTMDNWEVVVRGDTQVQRLTIAQTPSEALSG